MSLLTVRGDSTAAVNRGSGDRGATRLGPQAAPSRGECLGPAREGKRGCEGVVDSGTGFREERSDDITYRGRPLIGKGGGAQTSSKAFLLDALGRGSWNGRSGDLLSRHRDGRPLRAGAAGEEDVEWLVWAGIMER
jgi:hypothetical protein